MFDEEFEDSYSPFDDLDEVNPFDDFNEESPLNDFYNSNLFENIDDDIPNETDFIPANKTQVLQRSSKNNLFSKRRKALVGLMASAIIVGLFVLMMSQTKQDTRASPDLSIGTGNELAPISLMDAENRDMQLSENALASQDKNTPAQALFTAYKQAIAYIDIQGLMQTAVFQSNDNAYYLSHDRNGKANVWGETMADVDNDLSGIAGFDKVSVLYGHSGYGNQVGKKGFMPLKYINAKNNIGRSLTLTVRNNLQQTNWQLVSAGYHPANDKYLYPNPPDEQIKEVVQTVQNTKLAPTEYSYKGGDNLLILSTCTDKADTRFLAIYKLIEN